ITAALVDIGADLLARLGDLAGAVRLFAAADRWRDGSARPEPERGRAEEVDRAARTVLTARRYTAERSRGATFATEDVLRELSRTAAPSGTGGTGGTATGR
ncbi:hypothetical protein ABZ372_21210, partial [Streptomyces sp. NPDC005921]